MTTPRSEHAPSGHAAVIYHPGKVSLERLRASVSGAAARRGWATSRWYATRAADSGRAAAEAALAAHPAVMIVAGGDGTIRAVAEVAQDRGIPISLIPSGTGNLLSRNLGIPLNDIDACVAMAFSGASRVIDVGIADLEDEHGTRRTHSFLAMAGIGLDAEMAERTNSTVKRHLGWLAYVPPIARSIIANRLFHLDYRIDQGRVRSTRAHTVIVGNCGTLTGNMLLLPSAVVDDGLLDVVMMRPRRRLAWARIGARLPAQGIARRSSISRRLLSSSTVLEALAYAQGRQFEARFEIPHTIELDGDSCGSVLRLRIRIRPGALRVCFDPAQL